MTSSVKFAPDARLSKVSIHMLPPDEGWEPTRANRKRFEGWLKGVTRAECAHTAFSRTTSPNERRQLMYFLIVESKFPVAALGRTILDHYRGEESIEQLRRCESLRLRNAKAASNPKKPKPTRSRR